tara:strand:+ start:11 stop:202 length:192 start_codon:yes stop_codon:yes gene_type:complete
MQWIIENWLLVLVGAALIGMHLFGHGHSHGRKGGHDTAGHGAPKKAETPDQKNTDRNGEDTNA